VAFRLEQHAASNQPIGMQATAAKRPSPADLQSVIDDMRLASRPNRTGREEIEAWVKSAGFGLVDASGIVSAVRADHGDPSSGCVVITKRFHHFALAENVHLRPAPRFGKCNPEQASTSH
jgi:hypothetical protein